jgi:hypothetical protein
VQLSKALGLFQSCCNQALLNEWLFAQKASAVAGVCKQLCVAGIKQKFTRRQDHYTWQTDTFNSSSA